MFGFNYQGMSVLYQFYVCRSVVLQMVPTSWNGFYEWRKIVWDGLIFINIYMHYKAAGVFYVLDFLLQSLGCIYLFLIRALQLYTLYRISGPFYSIEHLSKYLCILFSNVMYDVVST